MSKKATEAISQQLILDLTCFVSMPNANQCNEVISKKIMFPLHRYMIVLFNNVTQDGNIKVATTEMMIVSAWNVSLKTIDAG